MYGGATGGQPYGAGQQYGRAGSEQYSAYAAQGEYNTGSRHQTSHGSLGHLDHQNMQYGFGLPAQDGSKPVHDMYGPSGMYFRDAGAADRQFASKPKPGSVRSSANNSKISKVSAQSKVQSSRAAVNYEPIDLVRNVKSEMQQLERDLGYIFRGFAAVRPFYEPENTNTRADLLKTKKGPAESITKLELAAAPKKPNKYVQDFMERNKLDNLDPLSQPSRDDINRKPTQTATSTGHRPSSRASRDAGSENLKDTVVKHRFPEESQPNSQGRVSDIGRPQAAPKRLLPEADQPENFSREPPKRAAKDLYKRAELTAPVHVVHNSSGHSFGDRASFGNTQTQALGNTLLQNTRDEIGFDSGLQSIQGSQLSRASEKNGSKRKEDFERFRQHFFAETRPEVTEADKYQHRAGSQHDPVQERAKMFTRGEGYEAPTGFGARKFK